MTGCHATGAPSNLLSKVTVILLVLFVSACSIQSSKPVDVANRIAILLNIQQYGRALTMLEESAVNEQSKHDPQIEKLREQFTIEAAAYEKDQMANAAIAQKKQKWKEAQSILQSARSQYVQSAALRQAQVELFAARDRRVHQLRIRQYKARAKHLNQEIKQLKKILQITPFDISTKQELNALLIARPEIARELFDEAKLQTSNNHHQSARELLRLSLALVNEPLVKQAARDNKRLLAKKKQKKRLRKRSMHIVEQPDFQSLFERVLVDYEKSVHNGDLVAAQSLLQLAEDIKPATNALNAQHQQLQKLVDNNIEKNVEQGKYQYSVGNIDAAIASWQLAYQLAPTNDALKERLQRAYKFQRKYEALKN